VQAVTVRQGGSHNKPVLIGVERVVLFQRGVLGIGRRRFRGHRPGALEEVDARS
jgi:hypothetical protein